MSGRDAWPLDRSVFQRRLRVARAVLGRAVARRHRVRGLLPERSRRASTRSAIRATSSFGHLVSLAELVALGGATMLLLLLAGARLRADRGADAGLGPRAAARGARQLLSQAVPRLRRRGGRAGPGAGVRHARLHRDADARRHRDGGDAHRRVRQPRRRRRRHARGARRLRSARWSTTTSSSG